MVGLKEIGKAGMLENESNARTIGLSKKEGTMDSWRQTTRY